MKYCKKVSRKLIIAIVLFMLYYFGVFTYFCTVDYDTKFSYPLLRNIVDCTVALSKNEKPDCPVINSYNYDFLIVNSNKCKVVDSIQLVMIIKSEVKNVERRMAIRKSWGYEDRFSDVIIKRVFIIGLVGNSSSVMEEHEEFGDIVLASFMDTYFNNTIKTMIGFKWAVTYCPNARFYLFSDDDMYISVKNILRFVRNPTEYPEYLEPSINSAVSNFINKNIIYELPVDVKMLAGFVFSTSPHRHICSKWYVPLEEYPYNKWPPYVSAGSYIVSKEALKLLYYASFFTKHFRFDDIYVGLLAKKVNIEPFHCPQFHIFKKPYNSANFKYALSWHGYHSDELQKIWYQQKSMGNA